MSALRPTEDRVLPPGRQLAITWSIPDAFGGMTAAMLRRSRSFARLASAEVDVLTFDGRPDYPAVRARLTELGELVDGVRLHNLYERLRIDAVAPGAIDVEPSVAGLGDAVRRQAGADGAARLEVRSPDGRARIAHLRADGSLAVLDERERPAGPRRLITAFDADGRPVRQWRSARACYAEWIAEVAGVAGGGDGGDGDAFAIVDSKTAARFMAHIRVPGLVTLHVVHNAHLEPGSGPLGHLRASRRVVLAHPERFDALVLLTERQRADVTALLADPGNLAVVPNATALPAGSGTVGAVDPVADDAARPPASAAVVASLTPRKRVDHAVRAIRLARDAGTPAELTVVGDGPELGRLREVARRAGVDRVVEFAGHRPDAAEAFAAASVALLTSSSEGAPLVLLEAMARGCIPIAYDIAYGPADLIEHGVNGFLVPPGDEAELARTIAAVAGLPPLRRAGLRRAARATARRFDEATVAARWGAVQRAAAERHRRVVEPMRAALERVRLRNPHGRLRVRARVSGAPDGARATVQLVRRRTGALLRRATVVEAGRVRVRLTREETALLDGGGPIRVTLLVEAGEARARLDGGAVHPDTRTLPRRLARRVRPTRPPGG